MPSDTLWIENEDTRKFFLSSFSVLANSLKIQDLLEHLQELLYLGWFFFKKKEDKKNYPTETLSNSSSILVFYPGGAAGHI